MSEEKAWQEFVEALEGLKQVHTHEQLEKQKRLVMEKRERLMRVSPEFKAEVERREREAEMRSKMQLAKYRGEYDRYMRMAEELRNPKMGVIVPQMVKSETVLACPKCFSTQVNWLKVNRKLRRKLKLPKNVKEVPWCFKCGVRMVEMPRSVIENLRRMKQDVAV